MRGRSRNKGPNPLTRSYESNGPDVKIRGTAQHVADKYAQLARDAQASGDPVAAENYFQHAEHYYRIIATAQEQLRQQYDAYPRPFDEDGEEGDDEAPGPANGFSYNGGGRPVPAPGDDMADFGMQPQPYDGRQDNGERQDRGPRFDRGDRQDRGERQDRGPRFDRGDRQDRGERRERFPRPDRPPRQDFQRPEGNRDDNGAPRPPRDEFQRPPRRERPRDEAAEEQPINGGLPAFLTNPVRVPIAAEGAAETSAPTEPAPTEAAGEDAGRFPRRTRRPRRPRATEADAAPESGFAAEDPTPAE